MRRTMFVFSSAFCPRSALLLVLIFLLAACSRFGDFARTRADKAAYSIIEEKQKSALGKTAPLSIYRVQEDALDRLNANAAKLPWSTDTYTTPTYVLSLADTLAIAMANNRDYLSQKESLFNSALRLTETRRTEYGLIFSGSADAGITRDDPGPSSTDPESFGKGGFALGVTKALASGADVSIRFVHDYTRYLTNAPRDSSSNQLSASIVQPLLRGFGPLVAREGLLQAERDMIYSVRGFQRYQQSFVINVASTFYGLLSQGDRLRNARENLRRQRVNHERTLMEYNAGRRSKLEVDQARQQVLQAEDSLGNTQARYSSQLENFKDFLNLPLNLDVGPDLNELKAIAERGLLRPDMEPDKAIDIALNQRLDLRTTRDKLDDAERAVRIAMRNFLPDLDATYSFNTTDSAEEDRINLNLRQNRQTWGLSLGLPFDWTPRRNNYRRALIAHEQSKRSFDESANSVIMEVRKAWRELERLRTSYEIQKESLALAERRTDSVSIRLQMGKLTTRDWLEAQQDLVNAQNAVTQALVDHTIERLRFWDAIERLKIDPKGMWYE